MPKISTTQVNKELRDLVFSVLFEKDVTEENEYVFTKINDRQYGIILVDGNGVERYVRVGAIVAEEREDMTAEQLMQSEIDKYNESVAKKEETQRKRAEKAAKDKAERERKAKEKESGGE